MAETGFKWQVTPGQAFQELYDAYTNTLFTTGARIMTRRAEEIEVWAQENAPWSDVTREARRTLHTETEFNPAIIGSIRLAHGVPYGLWLEIAHGGRWAIITKAIDHWGPIVWKDMQRMMNLGLITAGEIE